jgi:hypothetical protein
MPAASSSVHDLNLTSGRVYLLSDRHLAPAHLGFGVLALYAVELGEIVEGLMYITDSVGSYVLGYVYVLGR